LLVPDYNENGMGEYDEKLWRATSAMLAMADNENEKDLLARPHLIDFTQSQSQSQTHTIQPLRSWSSAPRRVISPFRIHPYAHPQLHDRRVKGHETSSPDSSDSFDTPLSVRQRRRRNQLAGRRGLFGVQVNSLRTNDQESKGNEKESMGEETFYGIRRRNDDDTPNTPSPIRFHTSLRSTSKFSSLDEGDDEEEEVIEGDGGRFRKRERERDLWSAELIDMDKGEKEVDDEESTPGKDIESSSVSSGRSEFELDVKEEESGMSLSYHELAWGGMVEVYIIRRLWGGRWRRSRRRG